MLKLPGLLALAFVVSSPALAGKASDWLHTEGGSIRIVTEAEATEEGILRGALQIVLKPGWKTYWADPGDSGIPPSVHVAGTSHIGEPTIGFPAPKLIDDGYAPFVGYDRPVTLALSFPVSEGDQAAGFTADLFLGVCETICIPVQASLELEVASNGLATDEIVRRAFADLPREASEAFHARLVGIRDDSLVIEAAYPDEANHLELHVVSTDTRMFGPAERSRRDDAVFVLPFTDTDEGGRPVRAVYTLVTDVGAVTGTLDLAN
jgi:DsbC/DsbD-like thiol-disulfide interchange protein